MRSFIEKLFTLLDIAEGRQSGQSFYPAHTLGDTRFGDDLEKADFTRVVHVSPAT